MENKNLFCITVILIMLSQFLQAQSNDISLTISGACSFPISQFGEKIGDDPEITRRFGFDYGEKVGLAGIGYGLGMEFNQKVLTKGLNWVVSAKLILNTVDNSEIQSFFQEALPDTVVISFENGLWMNIPILTGFSYYFNLSDQIRLYGTLQGGINITRQPYRKAIVDGVVVEETSFRVTPDFGFETGFGFMLFNKYTIGLLYVNLGTPRYEGTRKLNEAFFNSIPKREMNVDGDERSITMILLTMGYIL